MALPNELVSDFAKMIKNSDSQKEETVYGTIVLQDGGYYLRIDGSNFSTPMSATADALPGERVTAVIKNHSVIVNGNISSPAARTGSVTVIQERTEASALTNLIYPVGSIYMSVNETSPEILFGGAWEQIQDMFLLGCGTTFPAGTTGGSAEGGSGGLGIAVYHSALDAQDTTRYAIDSSVLVESDTWVSTTDLIVGGGESSEDTEASNTHMPPYLAVYVWKRIE